MNGWGNQKALGIVFDERMRTIHIYEARGNTNIKIG